MRGLGQGKWINHLPGFAGKEPPFKGGSLVERDTGFEPVFPPWKGGVEPLN